MKRCLVFTLLTLLFCALPLQASVFDLLGSGRDSEASSGVFYPKPVRVWHEKMVVNGTASVLDVDAFKGPAEDYVKRLRALYPQMQVSSPHAPMIVTIDFGSYRRRILIYTAAGAIFPTVAFTLDVPKQLPQPQWPRELPSLSNVQLTRTIAFPERETVSANFDVNGAPAQIFDRLVSECTSASCILVSGAVAEDACSATALFYDQDAGVLMTLGISSSSADAAVSRGLLMRCKTR